MRARPLVAAMPALAPATTLDTVVGWPRLLAMWMADSGSDPTGILVSMGGFRGGSGMTGPGPGVNGGTKWAGTKLPWDPGTRRPVDPGTKLGTKWAGTKLPWDPGTSRPVDPGTKLGTKWAGTKLPWDPGTSLPVDPGTSLPVDPGTSVPVAVDPPEEGLPGVNGPPPALMLLVMLMVPELLGMTTGA